MRQSKVKPRRKKRITAEVIRKEKSTTQPPEFRGEQLQYDPDVISEDIERGAVPDPQRANAKVRMANPGVAAGTAMHEGGGEFVGEPYPQKPSKPRVLKKKKNRAA